MMEIKNSEFSFNFISKFFASTIMTIVIIVGSLLLLYSPGLNYGVDFRGGAEVQVKFQKDIQLSEFRSLLASKGFDDAIVQRLGDETQNEYLIRISNKEANLNAVTNNISSLIETEMKDYGAEIRKTDLIGPKAGQELRISGIKSICYALLAIMIYLAIRFDFPYALGAIAATLHDVLFILGIFVLTQKEFTLQIVAALLTIIGYSVNDTVVIFDRVREHRAKYPHLDLPTLMNQAINETLSRTFLTAAATLFVAASMMFWGGGSIHDFFFAISIGIAEGAYSTIFVASPVVLLCEKFMKRKGPTGSDHDNKKSEGSKDEPSVA